MKIKKISETIGLTVTEIKVIMFLVVVLLTGFSIKTFFGGGAEYRQFDYSSQDSLFFFSDKSVNGQRQKNLEQSDKDVDSKPEVLNFDRQKNNKKPLKEALKENSIDINNASLNELILLPGIGEKTAEKIIFQRENRGGFKSLIELLEVKGIGKTKFNKIKKFLYIKH